MSSSDPPRGQDPAPNGEASGEAISIEDSRYVAGEVAEVSSPTILLFFFLFLLCLSSLCAWPIASRDHLRSGTCGLPWAKLSRPGPASVRPGAGVGALRGKRLSCAARSAAHLALSGFGNLLCSGWLTFPCVLQALQEIAR